MRASSAKESGPANSRPRTQKRVSSSTRATAAAAGANDARMVFFFYAGNGAQGALVSVAVSAGLMLLQRGAPEHLVPLLTCGLVIAAVAAPTILESLRTAATAPPPRPPPRDERAFAQAVERVRKMRTEIYKEPCHLTVAELRRRLGPKSKACLERRDLEKAFADKFDCCAICSESWASDDVYRVLPRCGHCFHVECIDRWALLSAGKGKRPTCPLCNAQL